MGLTKEDAPSAAWVPSGNSRHNDASTSGTGRTCLPQPRRRSCRAGPWRRQTSRRHDRSGALVARRYRHAHPSCRGAHGGVWQRRGHDRPVGRAARDRGGHVGTGQEQAEVRRVDRRRLHPDDHLAGTRLRYLDGIQGQLDRPVGLDQRPQLQGRGWYLCRHPISPFALAGSPGVMLAGMLRCARTGRRSHRQRTDRPRRRYPPTTASSTPSRSRPVPVEAASGIERRKAGGRRLGSYLCSSPPPKLRRRVSPLGEPPRAAEIRSQDQSAARASRTATRSAFCATRRASAALFISSSTVVVMALSVAHNLAQVERPVGRGGSHGIIDKGARSLALNPDDRPNRPITASIRSSSASSTVTDPSVTAVSAPARRISSWGCASPSANRE